MDEPLPDGAQSGLSSYIGSAQQSCTDLDSSVTPGLWIILF